MAGIFDNLSLMPQEEAALHYLANKTNVSVETLVATMLGSAIREWLRARKMANEPIPEALQELIPW